MNKTNNLVIYITNLIYHIFPSQCFGLIYYTIAVICTNVSCYSDMHYLQIKLYDNYIRLYMA